MATRYSSDSSTSEDSSESDDSYLLSRRRAHSCKSRGSPTRPKLHSFRGDKNWDAFIFQFQRQVNHYGSSERKGKERLLDCLQDKALDFVRELTRCNYQDLLKKMSRRFSTKEAPISARRQLQFVRQKEEETFEEFSQRVHFLAMEGLPKANDSTVDQMAVEAFLRGCKDKEAAHLAMEMNPKSIYKALKYVKSAVNNRKALFGSRANYHTRRVSFQDEYVGPTTDEASIRTLQESKRGSSEKLRA